MARVENLGPNVDKWADESGDGSSTYDVCRSHALQLERNPHAFNSRLRPYNADEPQGTDGWGGEVAHPCVEAGEQ